MTSVPSGGSTGGDLSLGPALEQLRRDNALTNEVHDPAEDEPHIVGIPRRYRTSEPGSERSGDPHS